MIAKQRSFPLLPTDCYGQRWPSLGVVIGELQLVVLISRSAASARVGLYLLVYQCLVVT